MTVRELIEALEKIDNKDLPVMGTLTTDVWDRLCDVEVSEVYETTLYELCDDNRYSYTAGEFDCVKIDC